MDKKDNKTRQEIYEYIVEYTKEHLFPPTIREIGAALELSSSQTVWNHLQMLETLGLIGVKRGAGCGIKLIGYEFRKIDSGV